MTNEKLVGISSWNRNSTGLTHSTFCDTRSLLDMKNSLCLLIQLIEEVSEQYRKAVQQKTWQKSITRRNELTQGLYNC